MKIKNKLNFLIYISLLFCFSQGNFYAQSEENDKYFKIADKLIPALSSSVKIDGYLGEKIKFLH